MTEKTPQKAWVQYFDNSKKDITIELENQSEFNEKKQAEIEALFLEAQTFEDVLSAIKVIGEIEDGPRTYEPADLEGILKEVKDKKVDLNQVPEIFGLRGAASRSLEAINHQEYQRNLKNLFREFKNLFDAKDFTDVFVSMKDSNRDNTETKRKKLQKEYNELRLICGPGKQADPVNNQTPTEIREIAEKASAMLDAYKAKADNFLGEKLSAETQAKNEKDFTLDYIKDKLGKGEIIKVKIEIASVIEDGWQIINTNDLDVIVEKKGAAGAPPIKLNAKLDDLKKWNAYTYTKKTVTDPKDNDAEKKKIEDKLPIAEELGKKIVSEETEDAKQAFEKRKGFNAKKTELEKSKKKEPVTPELIVRHKEIADKIKELDECRKRYLETDYDKTAKLQRLAKFFSNNFGEKKTDAVKDYRTGRDISKNDPDIGDRRKEYELKLQELQTLILDDAQARGLSNEELAKLYASFRIEQKITLADEHDKVKANNIPLVGEKIVGVVAWYQKLDWKYKLAIAGGFMAAGAGVAGFTLAGVTFAGAGASAAGIFASVVTARRIFGGLVAGVGAKQGLEVRGQARDQKEIEKEQQKILEELEKIKEQDKKYQQLTTKFDEIVTKDGQDALKKIKNQDFRQNLTAGLAGTFLASGLAGELIKMGYHGVADYFGGHEVNGASGDNLPELPRSGAYAGESSEASTSVASSADAHASEGLTIVKGSSIERTLIDHLEKRFPDAKNQGQLAHQIWNNYMTANEDAIVEKVGRTEYAKMLKDGMVNVKPGTIISIDNSDPDPSKWKITGIGNEGVDNDFSHLNVHEQVAANADTAPHPADVAAQAAADPAVAAEVATTAADHANASAEFAGNLVDNHSGPTLNENFVQYAPEHSDVPDLSGSLVQEDAPVEVKSNIIDFNLAIQNDGIDRSFYQSHGHGHFRPFLERHRRLFEQHDHQGALRELRKTMIRDGGAWRQHRTANVLDLMKNNKQIFSSEGKKMMAEVIKSEDLKPNGKIVSLEEYTRAIVKKIAA